MYVNNGLQWVRRAAVDALRACRVGIVSDAGAARLQGVNTFNRHAERSGCYLTPARQLKLGP
jgi:hypothetical protein